MIATVGRLARLIAPAGPLSEGSFVRGLEVAAELELALDRGAEPELWRRRIMERREYLAGTDEARVARLLDGLESCRASAPSGLERVLWMARGGYGCIRTLERADPQLFEGTPIPLWGFSDGTALLAAWDRAGWPAWHAPPVTQLPRLEPMSRARTRAAWHADHVAPFEGLETVVGGHAEGPLGGGNLCVLASLVGTPWQADLRGRIVLLEDTGEPAYKVDRLFTQLHLAGAFEGALGFVLGDFCALRAREVECVHAFFAEALADLGLPAARGLPVGHDRRNAPLPFGASGWTAILDVPAGTDQALASLRLDPP